jgi:trans-aconitate methyltransferase
MEKAKSYHDLVIKDGKFIGEFEKLYNEFDDPWGQSTQPNPYARQAGIINIKRYGMKSVLECGCGLGYYAEDIYRQTGIIPKSVDSAASAIERAKKLFPHLDFEQGDITKNLPDYKGVDCIFFAEIMWYVLPNLQDLFEIMRTHFAGKYFMVVQVFYKGTQKYGTEYFTSQKELIDYVPFELVSQVEATTSEETTIETCTLFKIADK